MSSSAEAGSGLPQAASVDTPRDAPAFRPWVETLLAVVVYCGVSVYFTWPLVRGLSDHVVHFGGLLPDIHALIWILAWGAHALSSQPGQLFEGNAFHPTPHVMATSEHMLGDQLVFAPVWLGTGNPVLAFNLLILLSFVFCALAMHLLIRRWTGSALAAFIAGLSFAFAFYRVGYMGRAHLLQVQYLPLILLFLDGAAVTRRIRVALLAALVLTLQILCSYYLGYVALIVVGMYLSARLIGHGLRGQGASWWAMAVAVLTPSIVLLPLSLPYLRAESVGALAYQFDAPEVIALGKLLSPSLVVRHFVGWGTLALGVLGGLGLASWRRQRLSAVRALSLLLTAGAGFVLAHGAAGIADGSVNPYAWLAALVPGFDRVRAPLRFAILANLGVSALAGLGMAQLLGWLRGGGVRKILRPLVGLLALVAVLAHFPGLPSPMTAMLPTAHSLPSAYRWLVENGENDVLLEVPVQAGHGSGKSLPDARAMYFSTYHWLPLVNGWTSYMPASYWFLKTYMAQLPAEGSLQVLADCTGLRWILVHGVLEPQAQAQWFRAWDALPGVRLRESFHDAGRPPDRIYEVLLGSRPGCASRLTQRDVTIEGHPLVRLTAMSGRLSIVGLDAAPRFGRRSQITVTIENSGTEIWPSTTISRSRVVLLSVSWTRLSDGIETRFEQILLPRDVAPGERVDFTAWLDHPRVASDHRLTVSASQGVRSGGPAITWERELNVVGPRR